MADDTPKWDCDITCEGDGCSLYDNNFYEIDISQEKQYVGKIIRLLKDVEMITNSEYYNIDDVYNYWSGNWGYVDRFMFELIPDTMFLDGAKNETHLGKLIAVLDKKK